MVAEMSEEILKRGPGRPPNPKPDIPATFDLKLELFKVMTQAFPDPLEVHIKLLPLGHPKLANRRWGPHYYVQIKGLEVMENVQVLERRPTKDGGELEVPVMKPARSPLSICCLVPKDAGPDDLQDYVDKLNGDRMRYQEAVAA